MKITPKSQNWKMGHQSQILEMNPIPNPGILWDPSDFGIFVDPLAWDTGHLRNAQSQARKCTPAHFPTFGSKSLQDSPHRCSWGKLARFWKRHFQPVKSNVSILIDKFVTFWMARNFLSKLNIICSKRSKQNGPSKWNFCIQQNSHNEQIIKL